MKITVEVSKTDVMSIADLGKEIANNVGWNIVEPNEKTPENGFRFVDTNDGPRKNKTGNYDIIGDTIYWDDATESSLFDCDSEDYTGESLMEMLDATTVIFGTDENKNEVVYTEE